MNSQLSRSSRPLLRELKSCMASTSKQGFSSSSNCRSEDPSRTSQTSTMQDTQAQMTPPSIIGGRPEGQGGRTFNGERSNRGDNFGGRQRGGDRRPPRTAPMPPPYPEWITKEGKQYEEAPPGRGPFWLGSTPFPLNPSFNPSPPISQKQKQDIWKLHASDPANTVRVISGKYGISMERIHAILRLQALESEWTKEGKVLQDPFNRNMERLLGAIEKPGGSAMEPETASLSKNANPRGPIYEESYMGVKGDDFKSAIVPGLEEEAIERATRKRTLPTGGPAFKGPMPTTKTVTIKQQRAPLTFVDMSQRPTSYIGAGVVARNQKRAEKRKVYKTNRAARKGRKGETAS